MKSKISVFQRRIEMLFMITNRKFVTLTELADCFGVHKNTVFNDVTFLSRYAPIYTKVGLNGGIYLLEGYSNNLFSYLSKDEETLLLELMKSVEPNKQIIIQGILNRYSMPKLSV